MSKKKDNWSYRLSILNILGAIVLLLSVMFLPILSHRIMDQITLMVLPLIHSIIVFYIDVRLQKTIENRLKQNIYGFIAFIIIWYLFFIATEAVDILDYQLSFPGIS